MASASRQAWPFTILNGQSLGSTIDLGFEFGPGVTNAIGQLTTPAGWDAATVTAQVSADGVTWLNLVTVGGSEAQIAAAITPSTSASIVVPGNGCMRFIRFRSGTGAAPVNQTADRAFTLFSVIPKS